MNAHTCNDPACRAMSAIARRMRADVVILPDLTITTTTEADRMRQRVTKIMDAEEIRIAKHRYRNGQPVDRPYPLFERIRAALR